MPAKQLQFRDEARRGLQRGVDKLADAVSTTLGPKGRNVAIDKKFGAPTVTHDGVAAAEAIAKHIKEQAIPISTKEEISSVASVSAQDSDIGNLIAEVMDKVGKD